VIGDALVRAAYRAAYWGARCWWFVRRPRTRGAAVAIWSGGRVLLVKTSYRKNYSLPGGFVNRHERPEDAAVRELHEEINMRVDASRLKRAYEGTVRVEHHDDTLTIWEVEIEPQPDVRANGRELVWVGWKSAEEAASLPLLRHVRDYLSARASAA
jgi:ADP-ribose pyrophosphatase YjhB (NUDIX family)